MIRADAHDRRRLSRVADLAERRDVELALLAEVADEPVLLESVAARPDVERTPDEALAAVGPDHETGVELDVFVVDAGRVDAHPVRVLLDPDHARPLQHLDARLLPHGGIKHLLEVRLVIMYSCGQPLSPGSS